MTKNKENGYSIIIPARTSEKFISSCLDSIERQTHFAENKNYEIILGIDACPITLTKVKEIKGRYNNLRVYYFKHNKGPYITKNNLIPLAVYDKILFFDSDDHMKSYMVSEIDKKMQEGYDICRFKYLNYKHGTNPSNGTIYRRIAEGVTCHKKKVHDILGGFEPWPCGADSDFRFRCDSIFESININTPLFFRRIHPESLTQRNDIGLRSPKRKKYIDLVENRISDGYYDNPKKVEIIKADYTEIK